MWELNGKTRVTGMSPTLASSPAPSNSASHCCITWCSNWSFFYLKHSHHFLSCIETSHLAWPRGPEDRTLPQFFPGNLRPSTPTLSDSLCLPHELLFIP